MKEDAWLECDDWRPMLGFLSSRTFRRNGIPRFSKRKWVLYVCAGLRCLWELLYDDASRTAVEVAEQEADGLPTVEDIHRVEYMAEAPTFGYDFQPSFIREYMGDGKYDPGVRRLLEMGVFSEADLLKDEPLGNEETRHRLLNAAHIAYHCLYQIDDRGLSEHLMEHLDAQAEWPGGGLVREIFGNPFRSIPMAPEWRTKTVLGIAHGAYTERAFDRLPILADALEEAGCAASEVLAHCRGSEPHALGCWALDWVLGQHAVPDTPADKHKRLAYRATHASKITIEDLGLSSRLIGLLECEGVTTAKDLCLRTAKELLEVRNLGKKRLQEVREKLGAVGLWLSDENPSK